MELKAESPHPTEETPPKDPNLAIKVKEITDIYKELKAICTERVSSGYSATKDFQALAEKLSELIRGLYPEYEETETTDLGEFLRRVIQSIAEWEEQHHWEWKEKGWLKFYGPFAIERFEDNVIVGLPVRKGRKGDKTYYDSDELMVLLTISKSGQLLYLYGMRHRGALSHEVKKQMVQDYNDKNEKKYFE